MSATAPGPARRLVRRGQAHHHKEWATDRFLRTLEARGDVTKYVIGGRVHVDLAELDRLEERGRIERPAPLRILGRTAAGGTRT